jgi:alpha-1,3-glucan synthase
MELYPERVYSKPEFTALPPYLFSGADFALIPSRDEPFGLVAVEFGRKGALGVGSRLGGLGLMPGWVSALRVSVDLAVLMRLFQWFPVESTSTSHMLSQLSKTIKLALKSTQEERAILRARSAVQRFPVVEWRQRIEDFHKRSIVTSRELAGADAWRASDCEAPVPQPNFDTEDWTPEQLADPTQPDWDTRSVRSTGGDVTPRTPGENSPMDPQHLHAPRRRLQKPRRPASFSTDASDSEDYFSSHSRRPSAVRDSSAGSDKRGYSDFLARANRAIAREQKHVEDPFLDGAKPPTRPFNPHSRVSSRESIASIVDEKGDSPLNKAMESVYSLYILEKARF